MANAVSHGSCARARRALSLAVPLGIGGRQLSLGPQPAQALSGSLHGGQQLIAPALEESRRIAREVAQRYRHAGAELMVREVSATNVLETVELLPGRSRAGASLPAANGIYFAICRRSPCALQRHALSRERALQARREAVELALRTLTETAADLVVVALPRRWSLIVLLVLTREDVQGARGAGADEIARGHLYVHGGLAPYSATRDSLLAFPLEGAAGGTR